MRYSTRTLLAVSTLVAMTCAGLVVATPSWATTYFTGALLLVLASIVAAIVRRGPARAYWIGFAVFANGYFWLAMFIDGHLMHDRNGREYEEPKLVTTQLLIASDPIVAKVRSSGQSATPPARVAMNFRGGTRVFVSSGTLLNFVQIGHSVFTLFFGLIGGWLGSWFHNRAAN